MLNLKYNLCAFLVLIVCHFTVSVDTDERFPLPVLLLLPYPDSSPDSGWDRGLELLPAARVAVKEINNNSAVLPGFRLQLIERRSDACGIAQSVLGLNNFVDGVFRRGEGNNAIAILGLACSTVTTVVSPVAGRDDVNLIQISMANSDTLRDRSRFDHLWRVISAVSIKVNATLSLMDKFNWTRVAQLYDGNGIFFRSASDIFRESITISEKYDLILDQAIEEDSSFIESALDLIQSNAARIIFVSATVPEAKLLMCEAARKNLIWPGYVWIFHSRSHTDMYDPTCDVDNILQAIENVTLINLDLEGRQYNDILVSGRTFGEYVEAYNEEVENIFNEFQNDLYNFDFTYDNVFANPMYDEVWALSLAIKAALPDLQRHSLFLSDYQYNSTKITEIIEKYLSNVTFEGAVSRVQFNSIREAVTPVTLCHVRNGTTIRIGDYDETTNTLTLYNISKDHIPDDDFIIVYDIVPQEVVITFIVLAFVAFVFTTVMLVLTFMLYNTKQIRATSPSLSILVYIGCYLLIISVPLVVLHQSFYKQEELFLIGCVLELLLAETAHCLIAMTILLRLIRVQKIFNGFAKLGRFWRDKYFVVYCLLFAAFPTIVHIIWMTVDPLVYDEIIEIRNEINPPTIAITPRCNQNDKILGIIFQLINVSYIGVILLLMLIFAFRTRKINYSDFKDTKKILILSYIFAPLFAAGNILWLIFRGNEMLNAIVIMLGVWNLLAPIGVQVFLFIPKVIPAIFNKVKGKEDQTHQTLPATSILVVDNY